jgi:surfeit locus 1 family protein
MRGRCLNWLRRPSWFAVLLTVGGVLLFVRLGVWQLDRAEEKEVLVRRYAAAVAAPQQAFAQVSAVHDGSLPARVRISGAYRADRVYLLDNPRHDERGGVEAYVPLQLDEHAPLLLVDLGFLPGTGDGRTPDLPALPVGTVALQGLYQPPPGHGFEMGGNALAQQSRWPKSTIYLDLPQVSQDLGHPLYPWVLALDADPAAIYVREHNFDFSSMPPARHRAYAFQWFTFAVAAVLIFLILHRQRCGKRKPSIRP